MGKTASYMEQLVSYVNSNIILALLQHDLEGFFHLLHVYELLCFFRSLLVGLNSADRLSHCFFLSPVGFPWLCVWDHCLAQMSTAIIILVDGGVVWVHQ